MTTNLKLDTLKSSLKCDHTLSEGQIWRHYGLTLADLTPNFVQTQIVVERSNRTKQATPTVMISLRRLGESATTIRHMAGLAEIRHVLGVGPNHWETARVFEQSTRPDAVWIRGPNNFVAIEYDICGYSAKQIARKVARFGTYHGQIWGTVSHSRIAVLRSHLNENDTDPEIFHAQWW
jgi:hypothetical protein